MPGESKVELLQQARAERAKGKDMTKQVRIIPDGSVSDDEGNDRHGAFARLGGCDCCAGDRLLADMSSAELQELSDILTESLALVNDALDARRAIDQRLVYVFGFISLGGGIGGFEWGFEWKDTEAARMRFLEDGDHVTTLRAYPLSVLTNGDDSPEAVQNALENSPYFWEPTASDNA